MVTYTFLQSRLVLDAAGIATAIGGTGVTAATVTGLAEFLGILAANKGLGLPPLLLSALAKAELNPQ
jgi:hypothetical protein